MSGSGRPLLAARASPGESSNDGAGGATPPTNKQSGGRAKRTLIESACSACRRRKSRCDGVRPACSRCQNLRTDCQYEAEEGESRWSALRRRNQVLEAERDQLRELLGFVQTRAEPEAMEIFQRIRQTAYEDIFALLRQVKDGSLGKFPQLLGAVAPGMGVADPPRLPPIQTILDGPARRLNPTPPQHALSMSSEESHASSINIDMTPILLHAQSSSLPDILEPAPAHPRLPGPQLSLSSEDSIGSMSSESRMPP